VTRTQLETIADEVAGVARNGIQALRQAALEAERNDHDTICEWEMEVCFKLARRYIRESNLQTLPFHHQLLYELIRAGDGLKPAELHSRYEEVADDVYYGRERTPVSERARRTKLSKLEDYDLIKVVGENRHREYYVRDEEVGPPLALNLSTGET
jgi:Cdc6-like AAA superfamily ATPase